MHKLALVALAAICVFHESAPGQTLVGDVAAVRDKALDDKTAWNLLESLTSEVG